MEENKESGKAAEQVKPTEASETKDQKQAESATKTRSRSRKKGILILKNFRNRKSS